MDEDTSATNFMVRDSFMQKVVLREKEPITPFLERAGDLYKKPAFPPSWLPEAPAPFFHIADTIIQMDSYYPLDITRAAKNLCREYPLTPSEAPAFSLPQSSRIMTKHSAPRPHRGEHGKEERLKIKVHGQDGFALGRQEIDLRYIEQLIDTEQTAALGLLLKYAVEHLIDGQRTLAEIITFLDSQLRDKGLSFLSDGSYISCGYAMPRVQEIFSCFNRYRRA